MSEQQKQPTPRESLIQAIESYASSKTVEDVTLKQLALKHLVDVLNGLSIAARVDVPSDLQEKIDEAVEAAKPEEESKED